MMPEPCITQLEHQVRENKLGKEELSKLLKNIEAPPLQVMLQYFYFTFIILRIHSWVLPCICLQAFYP